MDARIPRGTQGERASGVGPDRALPSPTLPKGGGAIRGIGEKFAANPVTGTGSLSVPIASSPGRSGFGPQLALTYDSGAGNGPFGVGWSLALPAIARKTDKGLPQYRDSQESDVFLLAGAEDLVPVVADEGQKWTDVRKIAEFDYRIHRYRPRVEGLFARIERWTRADGDVHWRSISKDNLLTIYGRTAASRIADPEDPARVFTWLICETRDDKGNAVMYDYKPEDGAGVDLTLAHERNRGDRSDARRTANRYLKRIRYGNRAPLLDAGGRRPHLLTPAQIENAGWMFEAVLDYGEHQADAPDPDDTGDWAYRDDPFSTYRAGFEVRTTRVCRRVLMFHHFPNEPGVGDRCLVRSTDFVYSHEHDTADVRNPRYTFLRAVTHTGYRRNDGGYVKRSLPTLEFQYTQPVVQGVVEDVDSASLENLPIGLDGAAYHWTDLHGEGIPGVLTEHAGSWFYKRNVSPVSARPVELAPLERVRVKPNLDLAGGQTQFMDLAGDGQPDLVVLDDPVSGFYEHDEGEGWQPFRAFTSRLNRSPRDPNLKFIDLDGDGHADVLISEDDAFVWHASLSEAGFGPARRVVRSLDEEKGPRVVFADAAQSIHLADLSGDGLTDIVRIRNGEVCYWPNLGYGRFGAKVAMDRAPWFDAPEQFDSRRIRLADIDGTGTTDIIYLHGGGVRLYFNESGNGWSTPQALPVFPRVDDLISITAADLRGNGTACLVWSSSLPGDARRQMRYVDLMGGQKPHLLIRTMNNLGAETHVAYAPSTKFYLQDRRDGRPWITRLPFPVHVVERVETQDRVSRNRFVTRYTYHHGYFDGEEREFRGFGMVEQRDTEEFAALSAAGDTSVGDNIEAASHVPPVLTRTWFHTGAYLARNHIANALSGEYYQEPEAALLDDTVLPGDVTLEEEREACRSLKGAMLRQEVYALDGTPREPHPYTVVEQNFTIRLLQHRSGNRHAVFLTHARESISYHYERNPADPRIAHSMTLEADEFGNVLKAASIGYGRRRPAMNLDAADRAKQAQTFITFTENRVTNAIDTDADHRGPLPCEARTYELTGIVPQDGAARFGIDEWTASGFALPTSATEIPYEQAANRAAPQKRLIEQRRTLYRPDDFGAGVNDPLLLLPLGQIESLALSGESYTLALTPGLLANVFQRDGQTLLPDPSSVLQGQGPDQGGYVSSQQLKVGGRFPDTDADDHWWIGAGRVFLSPDHTDSAAQERSYAHNHFFLPHRYRDPFAAEGVVSYDSHDMLLLEARDAVGNRTTAGERDASGNITASGNDYRVLQPALMTDANRNRAAVAFDALGMVVGTAVMGKGEETLGDSLADVATDLSDTDILNHLSNPFAAPHALLGRATTRLVYVFAYERTRNLTDPQPAIVCTLARETHDADLEAGQPAKLQHSFSYSDGFGREIQKKIQAEPEKIDGADGPPRWVGSGWTVFNNKGKPVRQYEPFFTPTHRFQFDVRVGVSPVLCYDPIERVVATLHPSHTWAKVTFDPWRQDTWDVNDTVLVTDPGADADVGAFFRRLPDAEYLPTWHARRQSGALGSQEQAAATKTAAHAATPATVHVDSLGRPFLSVAHNRFQRDGAVIDEHYATRLDLDVEGNQREVIDARGRIVMRYDYDLLGNRIHQASMEAGQRWMLDDVSGNPIRGWDSRGFARRMTYDPARRPVALFVGDGFSERLAERTVYGEVEGEALNHRGRVFQLFDGAGVLTNDAYDFKGNPLKTRRDLLPGYKDAPDWRQSPLANDGTFATTTSYDALNRPIESTAPDGSRVLPGYNEANLLERMDAHLRGASPAVGFVNNIDYNARGQRERIEHGNGTSTRYGYDPHTFRLVSLKTTRAADGAVLQDLGYTYDPAGNITRIHDGAQQTVFFNNTVVEPHADYVYDAVYRLIEATGREHAGEAAQPETTWNDAFRVNLTHPDDGQALRRYSERYAYDAVGNVAQLIHQAPNAGWTRAHIYEEPSQLANGSSNRLSRTTVGEIAEIYSTDGDGYDAHGNMRRMPHLPLMQWDDKDQLRASSRQTVGNGGTPEITYYVYDARGQRVRKVTERQAASGQAPARMNERIYLGGFEIHREYDGGGTTPTLERESLHLMDGQHRIAIAETKIVDDEAPTLDLQPLIRFQLGNHLGSASVELDDAGAVISYEEYFPYGSTSYQAGRSAAEVGLKRYRYTGKERDEESGLSYHGARYYAPWVGRWVSADPIFIEDGINVYVYCGDKPINRSDKEGMQAREIAWENTTTVFNDNGTVKSTGSERGVVTILPEVTVEGQLPEPQVLPEMVIHGEDPELTAAREHGWDTVAGYKRHLHTPGVIQAQDVRGFVRGWVNSSAASAEGIASLAGVDADLSALKLDVPSDEASGAFFGENLGPGPGAVLGATSKALGMLGKSVELVAKGTKLGSEAGDLVRDTKGALVIASGRPTPTLRKWAQHPGNAIDPATNKRLVTTEALAADHIVPKDLIKQLPGFEKLTADQQRGLLLYPMNFQGLEKSWNSSKGALLAADWAKTPMGSDASPEYIAWLAETQENLLIAYRRQIVIFTELNNAK